MSDLDRWWSFTVFVPGEDDTDEGYEYTDSESGVDLEDAKARYRREYPGAIILAGGEETD